MLKTALKYLNVGAAIGLLAGILLLSSGPGPWAAGREKGFMAGLHNSLYYLNRAKQEWAADKNKSEQDVPKLEELKPYLGTNLDRIDHFTSLGIDYKISSTEVNQSDVATLTRDLRFRSGYCLFYSAGTTYSLHTGWSHPPHTGKPESFGVLYFENNLDHVLELALGILILGNLALYLAKRKTKQQ